MTNLTEVAIHPQVRMFVAMLCEGFNVPSSETKIQAFANKLKHPHVPALKETYEIFTDGRASTTKMPTINLNSMPVTDWQSGYQFTLTRDEKGQDWVKFHNHPAIED